MANKVVIQMDDNAFAVHEPDCALVAACSDGMYWVRMHGTPQQLAEMGYAVLDSLVAEGCMDLLDKIIEQKGMGLTESVDDPT